MIATQTIDVSLKVVSNDDDVRIVFDCMRRSGQLEKCFPDDLHLHNLEAFTEAMLKQNWLYQIYYHGKLSGAVWLNRFEHCIARVNFSSFCRVDKEYIAGVRQVLDMLMELKVNDQYPFDLLIGLVDERNISCRMLLDAVGMAVTGCLPGYYGKDTNVLIYAYKRRS